MSFRMHNDYEARSESLSMFRDHNHEFGGDSTYHLPRRDELDHPTRSRRRRCLSPEPQRLQLIGDGDVDGENRDYDWGFSVDRNRHKQMMSRSPQFGLVKIKPQGNDSDSRRDSQYTGASERYVERGYLDEENYNDNRGLKPDYLLDNTRTTTRETFFHDGKLKNSGQYRRPSDELIRRPIETLSNHGERGENYATSKESLETPYYPEMITVDKSSDMESHKERDNPVTYSRDASYYPHVVPSKANGGGSFHYKDLEGTTSTTLRPNFSSSYMNGMPSYEDEYSRDTGKVVGGLGSTSYGLNCQSYLSDLRGDSEIAHKYLGGYQRDINTSPVRREGGYLNNRNGREIDGLGYPSDECRRVVSEDQVDHKQENFFRPDIRDTVRTLDTRDDRYGYLRSDAREHSTMKKQVDSVYSPGVSKSKAVSEIGKEFADLGSPYSQHDRRISRGHEVFHSDLMYDHDISPSWKSQYRFGRETDFNSHVESRRNLISDFGFGRDAVPDYNSESVREFTSNVDADSYTERIRELSGFKYEDEMDVLTVSPYKPHQREREAKEDLTHRRLKSKYLDDQQMNIHNSRKVIWSDAHDAYNRIEEWNDEDLDVQIPSRRLYDKNKPFQRRKRVFDRLVECEHVTHQDVLSSNDHHLQNHSGIHSRLGNGPSKGLPWLGSLGHISKKNKPSKPYNVWINEKEDNGRAGTIINDEPSKSGVPWLGSLGHINKKKKPNVWIKEKEYNGTAGTVDNDEPNKSERLVTSNKKSEPPEDSEEFKKLVHKAFLSFSKKLNENSSDQTSYKEQGRVGSLLCIVCGRSESKEFMDMKQLATHAFTSDEVGLRAQHLGLHKAICVLLGWQSVVAAPDINLYIPEPVSEEEALAQKEDLILWPPVVIVHTTSVAQDKSKLNIVDAVTEFLRGKGIGGNFKASLGRSANTVVLKYLGIFSNLQNAKRIEKYFLDNKRGRADFERVASSNKCSSTTISSSNDDDDKKNSGSKEEEENSYYGYMGISEDLDIIDLETMNKCVIKSKKEIQDLAHAPIIMPRN
ncbi:uncharacterized protein LOC124944852 [Impatiens glandulifera]|uniref:uncharacterized protein LOC124944852 n=1 Tax=Impatiens glandulifera TaxID=253017 RepID=UPI001FB0612F|nr:uncharacterized protein LOC124944852 [Impatiens glandulifera]